MRRWLRELAEQRAPVDRIGNIVLSRQLDPGAQKRKKHVLRKRVLMSRRLLRQLAPAIGQSRSDRYRLCGGFPAMISNPDFFAIPPTLIPQIEKRLPAAPVPSTAFPRIA